MNSKHPDYTLIENVDKYNSLVKTGLFFEFYPMLSGDYYKDMKYIKKISFSTTEKEPENTEYDFIEDYLLDGIIIEGDLDKLKNKNYAVLLSTDENEVSTHTFDTLNEVREYIADRYRYPDDSSWIIDRIYDLVNKKELDFHVNVTVDI